MLHDRPQMLHFNTVQHDTHTFSQSFSHTLRVYSVMHGYAVNGGVGESDTDIVGNKTPQLHKPGRRDGQHEGVELDSDAEHKRVIRHRMPPGAPVSGDGPETPDRQHLGSPVYI